MKQLTCTPKQHLKVAAEYIDLAKIAVGIGALLPMEFLTQKLAGYREHLITPFPGASAWALHAVVRARGDAAERASDPARVAK